MHFVQLQTNFQVLGTFRIVAQLSNNGPLPSP